MAEGGGHIRIEFQPPLENFRGMGEVVLIEVEHAQVVVCRSKMGSEFNNRPILFNRSGGVAVLAGGACLGVQTLNRRGDFAFVLLCKRPRVVKGEHRPGQETARAKANENPAGKLLHAIRDYI